MRSSVGVRYFSSNIFDARKTRIIHLNMCPTNSWHRAPFLPKDFCVEILRNNYTVNCLAVRFLRDEIEKSTSLTHFWSVLRVDLYFCTSIYVSLGQYNELYCLHKLYCLLNYAKHCICNIRCVCVCACVCVCTNKLKRIGGIVPFLPT